MKIISLEIDRFGVWRDVSLPFAESGVTVLYGPNEAGKSTLLRFVRGVLFGFQDSDTVDAGRHPRDVPTSGTLRLAHRGQVYDLRRTAKTGTRGLLEIDGRRVSQQDPLLQEILGNVSESLFRDVFAIGLNELQQLAALSGDEVGHHVYGVSLGREGDQLIRAQQKLQRQFQQPADISQAKGDVFRLSNDLSVIDQELARTGPAHERHRRLTHQRQQHQTEVDELKTRQGELQSDLRGFEFLRRIWTPWKKECELREKLATLLERSVDPQLLNEFDELETELAEAEQGHKTVLNEIQQLLNRTKQIPLQPELEQEYCAVERLKAEAPEMQALEQRQATPAVNADHGEEISELLDVIPGDWSISSIEHTDLSPATVHELTAAAYLRRAAQRTRMRLTRKYQRLNSRLKELGQAHQSGHSASPAELADLTEAITDLEELQSLRIRKADLQKGIDLYASASHIDLNAQQLPPYFKPVQIFFIVSGIILLIWGIYGAIEGLVAGGFHAAIIGACYACLGMVSLGTCRALQLYYTKQQFEPIATDPGIHDTESELADISERIQQIISRRILSRRKVVGKNDDGDFRPESVAEKLQVLRRELYDLGRTEDVSERVQQIRRQLSKLRSQLQKNQKVNSQRRSRWCAALKHIGLPESLSLSQSISACTRISEAQLQLVARRTNDGEADQIRLADFHHRIHELETRLGERHRSDISPYDKIAEWAAELELLNERRKLRADLRKQVKEKNAQADQLQQYVTRLEERKQELLRELGISDRREIQNLLQASEHRQELERQLQQVSDFLAEIVATQPDLMIVEEQLIDYNEGAVRQEISAIEQELLDIDEILQTKYEAIGKLRQELDALAQDTTQASMRFDRAQILGQLESASRLLFTNRVTDRALSLLRDRIEHERQPQTLMQASQLLTQLTCDKYKKIWTPVGEQLLMVDDERGQSFRVEHLSSGSREQVFLALRLAIIRGLAAHGLELPLVLDDVTVNFDQMRTEAAIETLLGFADGDQQVILLTCHLYLVHLFEQHNVDPIWLPTKHAELAV